MQSIACLLSFRWRTELVLLRQGLLGASCPLVTGLDDHMHAV